MSIESLFQKTESTVNPNLEAVKFSNGVEFTVDELSGLNPALVEKIQKVKLSDVEFARGFNIKAEELRTARAEIEQLKSSRPTNPTQVVTTPLVENDAVRLYQMKKMTEENFVKAKAEAEAKYGKGVVAHIGSLYAGPLQQTVEEGKYTVDFREFFLKAFDEEMIKPEVRQLYAAHLAGETKTAAELAKEKATVELLKSATPATTGLPSRGTNVVAQPILSQEKPTNLKAAGAAMRARLKEELEKQK